MLLSCWGGYYMCGPDHTIPPRRHPVNPPIFRWETWQPDNSRWFVTSTDRQIGGTIACDYDSGELAVAVTAQCQETAPSLFGHELVASKSTMINEPVAVLAIGGMRVCNGLGNNVARGGTVWHNLAQVGGR